MSTPGDEFAAHCVELMQALGEVRARRMFGAHGLYVDGVMVGLIAAEELFLKTDELSRPAWQAAGGRAFVYTSRRGGQTRSATMSYWTPPAEALESPALMAPWARRALEAALRQRGAARSPAPKASRAGRGRRAVP